jgi:O-antigen chain-terminating methyltransferase
MMQDTDFDKVFARLRQEFQGKTAREIKERGLSWYPEQEISLDAEHSTGLAPLRDLLKSLSQNRDPRRRTKLYSDTPFVGSLMVGMKKALREILRPYSNMILSRQADFNASLVQLLDAIMEKLESSEDDLRQTRNQLEEGQGELWKNLNSIREAHDQLLHGIISDLRLINEKLSSNLPKIDTLYYERLALKNDIEKLLSQPDRASQARAESGVEGDKKRKPLDDSSYYLFEEYYRGDSASLSVKQSEYLKYFKGKRRVLDVGCGRGEFLGLLRANGIEGLGVDSNPLMVQSCKEKGLSAECDDLANYLARIEDGSLGGVFCSQVIEHLQEEEITRFIRLSWQKLESGAVILVETLNPLSLIAMARHFYKDLTHAKPLHPDTLSFLLERSGFRNAQIRFMTPVADADSLKTIDNSGDPAKAEYARTFNENVRKLNDILFGYQEYIAIAQK